MLGVTVPFTWLEQRAWRGEEQEAGREQVGRGAGGCGICTVHQATSPRPGAEK